MPRTTRNVFRRRLCARTWLVVAREQGQTLVEFSAILAFVAVLGFAAAGAIASSLRGEFQAILGSMPGGNPTTTLPTTTATTTQATTSTTATSTAATTQKTTPTTTTTRGHGRHGG